MTVRCFARVAFLLAVAVIPTMSQGATVVTVSKSGEGGQFSSVKSALSSITNASSSNPYEILVYPGIYKETLGSEYGEPLQWKSFVSLRGMDRHTTILRPMPLFQGQAYPVINMSYLIGIHISDITIDARFQAEGAGDLAGSISVCNANITVDNVTYLNANSGGIPAGASFSCGPTQWVLNCGGNITISNSDLASIYESGNNWNIFRSYVHVTSTITPPGFPSDLYAYHHFGECPGQVIIIESVLETVAKAGHEVSANSALIIEGLPYDFHISDSIIQARTEDPEPDHVPTAIMKDTSVFGGNGELFLERISITGRVSNQYPLF